MSELKKNFDVALARRRFRYVFQFFKEYWHGHKNNIIPYHVLCLGPILVTILMYTNILKLSATFPVASRCLYLFLMLTTYIGWGFWRVGKLNQFLEALTDIFINAGLKTATGRLPSFVSDREVDKECRIMTLNTNRIPISNFYNAKAALESGFYGFIEEIRETREHGVVEILYTEKDFPKIIDLDSPYGYKNYSFIVGHTRSEKKIINLSDVPHFLVGGTSISGKSTFLRQVITTLYLNNPGADFTLIDLKHGLESTPFRHMKRINIITEPENALLRLYEIEDEIKRRGAFLSANNCRKIEDLKNIEPEKIEYDNNFTKDKPLDRHVVVIDEAADLFLASRNFEANDVKEARRVVQGLVAKGRAFGIHIFISTQRPDVKVVDPNIKANLDGRVCFYMADNASSMTILDSVRAADLPKTRGRAIWRCGAELLEVQVPLLPSEKLDLILDPLRVKKEKQGHNSSAPNSKPEVNKNVVVDLG